MGWRLARGVTPNFARSHPKSKKMRGVTQKMQGVTQKNARSHKKKKKMRGVTKKKMRGVTKKKKMRGVTKKKKKMRGVPKKMREVKKKKKMRGVTKKKKKMLGVTKKKKCEESSQKMRRVTPTTARSHPVSGGMAPHQFFKNNSISDVIKLRVLTVHEGHMGHSHYQHWRTEDSTSSCFCAILNVGKIRGVTWLTSTDASLYIASKKFVKNLFNIGIAWGSSDL